MDRSRQREYQERVAQTFLHAVPVYTLILTSQTGKIYQGLLQSLGSGVARTSNLSFEPKCALASPTCAMLALLWHRVANLRDAGRFRFVHSIVIDTRSTDVLGKWRAGQKTKKSYLRPQNASL